MVYGDKRDYKKIDIFVDGKYVCTTTWSKTCKDAVKHYHKDFTGDKVTAHFQNK